MGVGADSSIQEKKSGSKSTQPSEALPGHSGSGLQQLGAKAWVVSCIHHKLVLKLPSHSYKSPRVAKSKGQCSGSSYSTWQRHLTYWLPSSFLAEMIGLWPLEQPSFLDFFLSHCSQSSVSPLQTTVLPCFSVLGSLLFSVIHIHL